MQMIVFRYPPIVVDAVERGRTGRRDDKRDYSYFQQFRGGKERHITLKTLNRIGDASLIDDKVLHAGFLSLDCARESGRSCADDDDIVGLIHWRLGDEEDA